MSTRRHKYLSLMCPRNQEQLLSRIGLSDSLPFLISWFSPLLRTSMLCLLSHLKTMKIVWEERYIGNGLYVYNDCRDLGDGI